MSVELDVFSGKPNPRWELDERQAAHLEQFHAGLAIMSTKPRKPPALGYRGFIYQSSFGRCRAYQGSVHTSGAVLADPGFSIERFLLDQLPAEFAALRHRIASELGRET